MKVYSRIFYLVFESLADNTLVVQLGIHRTKCVCVMGNLLTKAVSPGLIAGSTLSRPYLLIQKIKNTYSSLPIRSIHSLQIACMLQRSYQHLSTNTTCIFKKKILVDYDASFLLKLIASISDVIACWRVQIPNKMSAYKLHNRPKRLFFFFSFFQEAPKIKINEGGKGKGNIVQ